MWSDTDKVHFPDGKLTPIPAWSSAKFNFGNISNLIGTCRSQWATKLSGTGSPYRFYGTHSHLFVEHQGALYNITPLRGQRAYDLGADPLEVHSGDATLTITATAHGLSVGDHITLSGATDIGGVNAATYINIEHHVATVPDADTITVEMTTTASSSATGGGSLISVLSLEAVASLSNPLDTTNGSKVVTVNYTAHGLSTGDRIKLSDSSATGGVPDSELNAEHIITVVDDDSFTIIVTTAATSDVTAGGGTDIHIFTQIVYGNENQSLGTGFGYGTFGYGIFGNPFVSDSTQQYPRIWSLDNFGNDVVICPGDYLAGDGQKIYIWSGDTDVAPTVLTNAPENCNWVNVVNNAIVALCDDSIRICEIGNGTVWSGLTATTIDVQRAFRLISSNSVGEKASIIFAPEPYYLAYVGGEWDLVELNAQYPIIAPLAAAQFTGGLLWVDVSSRLCYFNGSSVDVIINDQNGEYIRKNINNNAAWTVFLFHDPKHKQVWTFWPSTGETSPDQYMIFNPAHPSFTLGALNRTSSQRPYILDNSFYMTNGNDAYSHFTGAVTDFNWYGQSAYFFTANGEYRMKATTAITDCSGTATLTMYGLEYPQAAPVEYNSFSVSGKLMHIRAAGRLLSTKFSGDSDFTLEGIKIDILQQGRRI